jgi:trimethylamine---corrinoid protein Co-methyltransferase
MEPIRVLSSSQMEMIDDAAASILDRTGMIVRSEEALDLLGRFGCSVDRSSFLVRFPKKLTRGVVEKMRRDYTRPDRPERMNVRFSHVRFRKTPHQVHQDFTVSAGGFVPFIFDLDGNRRTANRHDVLCSINMVNHLRNIDLTGLPVSDQTVPARHRPVAMAADLARYTRKLGGIETFRKEDVPFLIEIARIVAGSDEEFRRFPSLVGYAETRSPLCFDENMIDIFLTYLKLGVPQTVDCMPSGGATAPVTTAGVLALGAAETIGAMTLAYALRDDAVVGLDITPSFADMTSGNYKYGGGDRCSLLMARIQLLSEYYGCPTGVHGGKTDSCFLNEQAGIDKAASMLLTVLAGAVGIGTVGAIENAVTFSPVQLVIDNELAAYVRRAIRCPIEVSPETLAVEVVHQVGPGGSFLSEMHTAEHFRDELLLSPLFPAQAWDTVQQRRAVFDTVDRAAQIARELWHPPDAPVLSDGQIRAVEGVVRRAQAV